MRRLRDRKSTRLNSSHTVISYAVFCLKKKKTTEASPVGVYRDAGYDARERREPRARSLYLDDGKTPTTIAEDLGLPLGVFFFFNDTATTEIYTLSLHDALPI